MKRTVPLLAWIALAASAAVFAAGSRAESARSEGKERGSATAPAAATIRGTVHSIRMPELAFDLPAGANRDEVVVYCGVCHTTRYIMIQPPLTRQTWLSEVTKMRTAFSAPIPEQKVPEIVDYLAAVRGPNADAGKKR